MCAGRNPHGCSTSPTPAALYWASGVKLVPGSPNCLAGDGDAFNGENIVVILSRGKPGDEEAPGDTLNVLWFPEGEESPFTLGDPMETLGEAIRLAGE